MYLKSILLATVMAVAHAQYSEGDLLKYSRQGDIERVNLILNSGVHPDAWNSLGQTSLLLAARGGHLDVVIRLLEAGANFRIASDAGDTPLLLAAHFGYADIAFELTDVEDSDVDARNNEGDTALMLAASNGHFPVVNVLVDVDASIDAHNKKGHTAACLAEYEGHLKIAEFLHSQATEWEECAVPKVVEEKAAIEGSRREEEMPQRQELYGSFFVLGGLHVVSASEAHYINTQEGIDNSYKKGMDIEGPLAYMGQARGPWRYEFGIHSETDGSLALLGDGQVGPTVISSGPHFILSANGFRDFRHQSVVSPYLGGGIGVRSYGSLSMDDNKHDLFSVASPLYWQLFAGARMNLIDDYPGDDRPGLFLKMGLAYARENMLKTDIESFEAGNRFKFSVGFELFSR